MKRVGVHVSAAGGIDTITTSDPHKVHKFSTKYTTQWQQ